MSRFLISSLLLVCIQFSACFATVVQINDFSMLEKLINNADKSSLVVFDVDNVLIKRTDQIMHPKFRQTRKVMLDTATDNKDRSFANIITQTNFELVNKDIVPLIQNLQSQGVMTIALTHFGTGKKGHVSKIEDVRINNLLKMGLVFNKSTLLDLEETRFESLQAEHGVPVYKDGILFTGEADKGAVLEAFMKYANIKPSTIVFIDDLKENIDSVATMAKKNSIDYAGLHYTEVAQTDVGLLNQKRADLQINMLVKKHK